ncbi:ATP-binding cassette subfamily C protein CydCD [Solirubrobacter pauli]|uniref:ATP-binding cassette subfamily C protein CydCD n=1 Tax=Solirubrobacter pauli TaxID=166793 RepID=A0A660LA40_9ACTN|nr:thiol reductant ABC exporter subunit CydD [Solirubrobacter pauli]RKQ91838.1 ATP-binding cassette subfamily C protein CydCD [Solirubrobacter pauli]
MSALRRDDDERRRRAAARGDGAGRDGGAGRGGRAARRGGGRGRGPLPPVHLRLLSVAPRARAALAIAAGAGLLAAALLVVQAWLVADAVATRELAWGLLLVVAARALLAGVTELAGRRAAEVALSRLRERVAARALAGRARDARRGDIATAATQGLDALAEYYARAVPQLALGAAVPIGVVAVIATRDLVVGVLLGITLPIVVVFMVLVGRKSAEHARERQHALAVLGAHFLEVVRGLPTLRAHGREQAQAASLQAVGERYRDESLGALRVAFLSALVLEFLAMLGTAIAAAVVGVQLAEGHLDLAVGLFVLILAPEVYAPLRAAGARFHAAEDGAVAVQRLFDLLDEPAPFTDSGNRLPAGGAIVLRGVGVDGHGRPDPLHGLDLTIEPGTSVALVGPSGAGKSTLLRLLARVQDPDSGRITVGGVDVRNIDRNAWWHDVTWLDQRPPLPTGTLGEALRLHGGEPALRAADAEEIVAAVPETTRVGAGGRPFSRGQEQRLGLAAALGSDAPLLLLDEPTAHLDQDSTRRVAEGILAAARGRTLVVATHDARLASLCDVIVDLAALDPPRPDWVWTSGSLRATRVDATGDGSLRTRQVLLKRDSPASSSGGSGLSLRGAPVAARPARQWPKWAGVALGVAGTLSALAVLATSGWLVTRAAEQPPVLALLVGIVTVRALGLVRALARYGERLASHDVALRQLADVRVRFFERLAARIGGPGVPGAADLLARFTSDVDELQHLHPRVVLPAAVAVVASLGVVLAAGLILPVSALILAAGLAVATLLVPAATHALARHTAPGKARAAFGAQLVEALTFGPQLAVAGQGAARLLALTDASRRLARIDRGQARAAAFGAVTTQLAAGATLAGVIAVGTASDLATVWLGALVLLTLGAFEAPAALPEAALRLIGVRAAKDRLAAATSGPERLARGQQTGELPRVAALTATGIVHRPGGPGAPVVLDGVDLAVEPGQHVAIVGPSGAGKSTLADLLTRLADPDAGTVALGGVDLKAVPAEQTRERIRLAGQDAHLLAGTVAANVRIGRPEAGDADIIRALREAGLAEWLAALPDGIDTRVGEDGVAVSGGQRQRIGLARALISLAEIIVLDEPTAMLDPETARAVREDILATDRTLIVITHDPTGLEAFDAVLELRDGALDAVGGFALR